MSAKKPYDENEKRTLMALVEKYRNVVEAKRYDSTTISKKRRVWAQITSEYNRHPDVQKRLAKQLKKLWENLKHRAKQNGSIGPVISSVRSGEESLLLTTDGDPLEHSESNNDNGAEDFDEIFIHSVGNSNLKVEHREEPRRLDNPPNATLTEDECDTILAPIITARIKKLQEAIDQQSESHRLTIQRHQLQNRLLQDQLTKQSEVHALQLDRERELHDLRMSHEKELQAQRLRNERELHQLKIAEYNKAQIASQYPLNYK